MRIVLDTSVLYSDLALQSPESRLLLGAAGEDDGDIEVVVPEVVALEATNVFRERLDVAVRAYEKAHKGFTLLGMELQRAAAPNVEVAVADYATSFRQRLNEAGVRVPDPPEADHLDLAKRAIQKRKPFDAKGRGYRDSLIWLQVLEEAAEDEVVLVTANTQDFASGDPPTLAPELAADLEALGLKADGVSLAVSIREVVQRHVEPSVQALTRMQALLPDDAFQRRLTDAIVDSVVSREVDAPEDDEELRQLDVRQVEIVSVEDVRDLEIDEAYEAAAGSTLTFNFGGTLVAEADFYPYKYEAYGAETPGVTVSDWDWNDQVVQASKTFEFGIEGVGEYNVTAGDLVGVNVWLVY